MDDNEVDRAYSLYGPMVKSCEHENEISVCVKGVRYIGQLTTYLFLKKGSTPCSQEVWIEK